MKLPTILNSAGQPIVLNAVEKHNITWIAQTLRNQYGNLPQCPTLSNALGYEIAITSLTGIQKRISEQKFFETAPADFMPIKVGENSFKTNLTTYRSFDIADEFETGVINTGGQSSRLASADAGVDALNIKVFPWGKSLGYSIFDLEFAAQSGNWDLIAAKEKARKRNWDLGIQRIAFLGARGNNGATGSCLGFLNQVGITTNTTIITQPISAMSPTDLKALTTALIESYRSNNNRTAWPKVFAIPESDYNGLAGQASPTFPMKSTLQLLEEMFQVICRNKDFKILPLAYADAAYHTDAAAIAGKQVYTLTNYDEESSRMDIPLDYTTTLANSIDNFNFQSVGYGQFTGLLTLRPLETMYYTF